MTDVIMFHHAQGRTEGVRALADDLHTAGHRVTVPDLYDGRTFDTITDGVAHAKEVGFATILDRARAAAERLPPDLVYVGLSLGALPAQMLAQTRPGAIGAVLLHGCLPPSEFGTEWPKALPVQIHGMEADEFFLEDLEAARSLVETTDAGELYLYPGDRHLFSDRSLPDYDEAAATLLTGRMLGFLDALRSGR